MNSYLFSASDLFEGIFYVVTKTSFLIWAIYAVILLGFVNFVLYWIRAFSKKRFVFAFATNMTPLVILAAVIFLPIVVFATWNRLRDPATFSGQLVVCGAGYLSVSAIMSAYTFFLMAADKWNAVANQKKVKTGKAEAWRVPERLLHTCEFVGGWSGSLAGQFLFRHKVSKSSYQQIVWMIVLVHLLGISALLLHLADWSFIALALVCVAGLLLSFITSKLRV